MTPDQAERLRDLFFEARQTARNATLTDTVADFPESYAADDAAVEAFNTALKEATKAPSAHWCNPSCPDGCEAQTSY